MYDGSFDPSIDQLSSLTDCIQEEETKPSFLTNEYTKNYMEPHAVINKRTIDKSILDAWND